MEGKDSQIGFDHNYMLGAKMAHASHENGRTLTIYTSELALQFYCGKNMDPNGTPGKDGAVYYPNAGFCFET